MKKLLITILFTSLLSFTVVADNQVFYDDFSNASQPWKFYQGAHSFTNGVLKLTVAKDNGMYAWIGGNWTNVSIATDVKLHSGAWGAAAGVRLNTNNGANYQVWIYSSGRMTIEKYNDWYNIWTAVANTSIPVPGLTTNTIKLIVTNNVLKAYLNNIQLLTYTDTSNPLINGGAIDLSIWGGLSETSVDFDNVIVNSFDFVNTNLPPAPTNLMSITLAWDVPMGTNIIAGYKIYCGTNSKTYTRTINTGNVTTYTVSNLVFGQTYYFAATAYDTFGLESDYSNEINNGVEPQSITYLGTRLEWWTNLMYVNRQTFYLTSFTNPPIPQFYRSYLLLTNGPNNTTELKTKLEWYTNMTFINREVYSLKSFTNASYFFRSFLVITNKPF